MMPYQACLIDYDPDLFDLTPALQAEMAATLAGAGATLTVGQWRSEAAVLAAAADADLVLVQSVRPLLTAAVIPQLHRCRGIVRLGLGYDSVDVAAATAAGIPVSNVQDWCEAEVAEHTLALLLAAARRLGPIDRSMQAGAWERAAAVPARRLAGKTAGIIGFGRVGRRVAGLLCAFGARLLVHDPHVTADEITCAGAEVVTLDDLLGCADFITLHARLTPESHHLLGAREFAQLRPGAILVNTARGGLIDEAALIAALRTGRLAAAGLDVMEHEPLAADSPLRRMANVILSPHVASYSVDAVAQLYRNGAAIAADLLAGAWPATIVNPQVRSTAEARWTPITDPSRGAHHA